MYRFVVAILEPFTLALLLAALAAVNLWRKRAETRRRLLLVAAPLAVLAALSMPAVAYVAMGSLEWRYQPRQGRPDGIEAIVVLSGTVRPPDNVRREAELGENTLHRCLHAARLYRQGGPCLVVVSGGKVDPRRPGPTCAEAMRDFLVGQGVAESDLLLESRSRTTYENAVNTCRLLQEANIGEIVLVTDAMHMLRAERCFLAQGRKVFPAGCRYRATHFTWSPVAFLPRPSAADDIHDAAHEWLGIAWYWLQGRI